MHNRCCRFHHRCFYFLCGGKGRHRRTSYWDKQMPPSRSQWCLAPTCTAETILWSSCSERWGWDPCLNPGAEQLSAQVHTIVLKSMSDTFCGPNQSLQCRACMAAIPSSSCGCYSFSVIWQFPWDGHGVLLAILLTLKAIVMYCWESSTLLLCLHRELGNSSVSKLACSPS